MSYILNLLSSEKVLFSDPVKRFYFLPIYRSVLGVCISVPIGEKGDKKLKTVALRDQARVFLSFSTNAYLKDLKDLTKGLAESNLSPFNLFYVLKCDVNRVSHFESTRTYQPPKKSGNNI